MARHVKITVTDVDGTLLDSESLMLTGGERYIIVSSASSLIERGRFVGQLDLGETGGLDDVCPDDGQPIVPLGFASQNPKTGQTTIRTK